MFVTEQILTVPQSHFNLLKARLRVAAFPCAARAGALVILCIRKQSWVQLRAWLRTLQRVTPCSTTKLKSDGSLHLSRVSFPDRNVNGKGLQNKIQAQFSHANSSLNVLCLCRNPFFIISFYRKEMLQCQQRAGSGFVLYKICCSKMQLHLPPLSVFLVLHVLRFLL